MQALDVQVLATTPSGTRAALAAATALGTGLSTRAVLLVPYLVPYPQDLNPSADMIACAVEPFRRMVDELDGDVEVRVCACRPQDAALTPLLSRDTTILVGGRSRRGWPTPAQRVAALLARRRYPVLFVEEG